MNKYARNELNSQNCISTPLQFPLKTSFCDNSLFQLIETIRGTHNKDRIFTRFLSEERLDCRQSAFERTANLQNVFMILILYATQAKNSRSVSRE